MNISNQKLLQEIAIGRVPHEQGFDDRDVEMNFEGVMNGEEQLEINYGDGELQALAGNRGSQDLAGGFYKL